jgi:hypothetical protein
MYMIFWKWSNGEKYKQSDKNIKNKPTEKNIINDAIFYKESKREEMGSKLSERTMIAQIGLNPFLQNSYEHDIDNYDKCMKK